MKRAVRFISLMVVIVILLSLAHYYLPPVLGLAAQPKKGGSSSSSNRGFSKRKPSSVSGFASTLSSPSKTTTTPSSNVPALSSKAKKLLQRHGNNVDAASNEFFASQLQSMLHENNNNSNMLLTTSSTTTSEEHLHNARVAAAWDSIALFLPQDYARSRGKVEPHVERRLQYVVQICLSATGSSGNNDICRLLDVGCGDGALLNYLNYNNDKDLTTTTTTKKKCEYVGVDISSEMIDLGLRQHPNADLRVGSFPSCLLSPDKDGLFDVILFNGSLQFFRDTRQVLHDAATKLLAPNGRIILCHVNGAKFVREECRTNPSIAVRNMPNTVSLREMANLLGMKLVDRAQVWEQYHIENFNHDLDGHADQFYLEVLVRL